MSQLTESGSKSAVSNGSITQNPTRPYDSPGSSKDTYISAKQPVPKSEENDNIEEITSENPEEQESSSAGIDSWNSEKARRNRWRRIYGTDMYQNDGEITREKGISRSFSDMSAKRLENRKRLTRKLSEMVLVPLEQIPAEEDEEQKHKSASQPSEIPVKEETEIELEHVQDTTIDKESGNRDLDDECNITGTEDSTDNIENQSENLNDVSATYSADKLGEERESDVDTTKRVSDPAVSTQSDPAVSTQSDPAVSTQSDPAVSTQSDPAVSTQAQSTRAQNQENVASLQDNEEQKLIANGSVEADKTSESDEKQKVTLKDLYREIKLMRQVMKACAGPDFRETPDIFKSQHGTKSRESNVTIEKSDTELEGSRTDKTENDEMEIQRVQEANLAPATPSLSELCDTDNISGGQRDDSKNYNQTDNISGGQRDDSKNYNQTEEDDYDDYGEMLSRSPEQTYEKYDDFSNSERNLQRSRHNSEAEPSIGKGQLEHQKKINQEGVSSVGQGDLSSEWDSCWSSAKDKAIRVINNSDELVLGCVLHMSTDTPVDASVDCVILDPSEVPSITGIYEILVSNIVEVSPMCFDDELSDMAVGVPFLKYEMKYFQEPVLRYLDEDGHWQDGLFAESIFRTEDDIDVPILLTRVSTSFTFAIVAKPIVDDVLFTGNVANVHSTVDSDIFLSCPSSIRINQSDVHVELKVLPIIPEVLEETKQIYDDGIRRKLYSAGAVVTITFFDDPPQTIYVNLPCVKPPSPSRPVTGNRRVPSRLGTPDSGYRSASRRSAGRKSAFGRYIEPSQEKESHLVRFSDCMPSKVKRLACGDVTDDDKVVFTVHEKTSTSVVVDITKGTKPEDIKNVVAPLLHSLEYQRVHFCVAHNKTRLTELNLLCDRRSKVDTRKIMKLEKDNDITKTNVSLKEGDTICLNFRGNISSMTAYKKIFRYYGVHGIHTAWTIGVVDKFAQRSLNTFCGFLQVFVWNLSSPFSHELDNVDIKSNWRLLLEIPISLPKTEQIVSFKVARVPICVRMEGPLTADLLDQLAHCIGDEWPLLARYLRIDHPRLQSIIQQNKDRQDHLVRDVLLTWFKRSLFAKEKASTLIHALRYSGRSDLSESLRESYRSYRRERSRIYKEQRLQKVIASVSKSEAVVKKWADFAHVLGFVDEEINVINTDYKDDKTRCSKMLLLWKQRQKGHGFKKLIKSLREIGRNSVADYLVTFTATRI